MTTRQRGRRGRSVALNSGWADRTFGILDAYPDTDAEVGRAGMTEASITRACHVVLALAAAGRKPSVIHRSIASGTVRSAMLHAGWCPDCLWAADPACAQCDWRRS